MHLQVQPFGKTKAAGVDDGQGHANGRGLDKRKDVFHFVGTQDDRELCPLFRANEIKDEPFPLEGFLEEKLDAGKMDREGASRNASFLHKIKEIGTDFFLGNVFRCTVVMAGKSSDGAKVGGLRLCRVSMQLHVLDHSLSDCAHWILLSVWFMCLDEMDTERSMRHVLNFKNKKAVPSTASIATARAVYLLHTGIPMGCDNNQVHIVFLSIIGDGLGWRIRLYDFRLDPDVFCRQPGFDFCKIFI